MRLWKRASALLKDRNSIYLARLSRRSSFRNPELEEAVIKATSHDETYIDYKNAQRIFTWIRTTPKFLKPVIWSLSSRMEKTKYWVVALKGLMLMHGIFCCKIPSVQKIGRLPFDFSNFTDAYSDSSRSWCLSTFIRGYFAYLDQKSVMDTFDDDEDDGLVGCKEKEKTLMDALGELQRSQSLLDMLLQVKPFSDGWDEVLVLEAMDCIVIEIFDVYSRICNGIAGVLVRIYSASRVEAEMALDVLHKATCHGEALDSYFAFCRRIGVLNASEFPNVEKIPEEDILDLERAINGLSKKRKLEIMDKEMNMEKALIPIEENKTSNKDSTNLLKTVITDKWVVFEDEFKVDEQQQQHEQQQQQQQQEGSEIIDPFAASINVPPLFFVSNDNFNNQNGLLQMQQHFNSLHGQLSTAGHQRNLIFSL